MEELLTNALNITLAVVGIVCTIPAIFAMINEIDPDHYLEWLFTRPAEMWRRRKWAKLKQNIFAVTASPEQAAKSCSWLCSALHPCSKRLVEFFTYDTKGQEEYAVCFSLKTLFRSQGFTERIKEIEEIFWDLSKEPFCSRLTSQELLVIDSAFKQMVDVVKEIEALSAYYPKFFVNLKNTDAHKKAVRELLSNAESLYETLGKIITALTNIKDGAANRVVSTISDPKPIEKPVDIQTQMERILSSAQNCGSKRIYKKIRELSAALKTALAAQDESQTYERISSFYLPTLSGFIDSIVCARENNSENFEELESLCLQAIDVISGVVAGQTKEQEEAQLRSAEIELATLKNFASLKGDATDSLQLQTTEER